MVEVESNEDRGPVPESQGPRIRNPSPRLQWGTSLEVRSLEVVLDASLSNEAKVIVTGQPSII